MNATADHISSASATSPTSHERHVVLRHRLSVDGVGAPIIGVAYLLAVLLLTATVSTFTEIRISGWEAGTQLVRWFVGAIGVYLTAVYLPLYIAYGRTRREVASELALFATVYAVLVGVLVTVGFAIESLVYRIAGWSQTLENVHLFEAPDQYHLILLEHVLVLMVWVAAGAMLGAAFYRRGGLGMVLIPVGLAAVILTEVGTGPGFFGPLPPPLLEIVGLQLGAFSPLPAAATSLVSCVVLLAVTWRIVRDIPIRTQTP